MSSRVEKYVGNSDTYISSCSRVDRNAKLYRQVYGKYEDLDNLPIEDNTDEIDMEKLKELVTRSNNPKEHSELRDSLNILDTRERKIDENKVYDINKLLEKAKNDNSKLKDSTIRESIVNKSILSTLESREISLEEIKKASKEYENNVSVDNVEELTMTRELKFKELSDEIEKFNSNPLTSQVMSDNELAYDLFEELKPTGNTIVTKPLKEEQIVEQREMNFHSSDTKDIDVIKSDTSNLEDFFTSSYEFSKKDFAKLSDDDDFFEMKKDNNVLKIILLILMIIIFTIAIVYFILNYGLGV